MTQSKEDELALLRATLAELRAALPKCSAGPAGCQRVAVYNFYHDGYYCDEHVGRQRSDGGMIEEDWAAVVRRLGW